jgi:hypothetical protein
MTLLNYAEAAYSGCCECVFYHTYCQERSLLFRDIKNKSQLIAWKIIPADNAYWRCRLKRRHSRVIERVELKIDGLLSSAGQYVPPEVYHISTVSTSRRVSGWPSERRKICSWWYCSAVLYAISVFSVPLHLQSQPRSQYKFPQPPTLSSSYGLLGSYAVSAEIHGITLKDRNLSADHLEVFHTHRFDQHLHRQNHVPSELPAPL